MAATFYHVDRLGGLEPGDVLDLDWSLHLADNPEKRVSPQEEPVLRELYPEGLSRHGARYASTIIGVDQNASTPGQSQPLVAFLETVDPETQGVFSAPTNALYEWFTELVRLAEFPDQRSRFQSFFAWENRNQISDLPPGNHPDQQIVKVQCEEYARRDMSLVKVESLSQGIVNARIYWESEAGDDPTWEILMEPPVEVIDII